MEILSGGIAAISIGVSIAAMALSPSAIVVVAGLASSAIGPYAYYQQKKLTDIIALKETYEVVKREVSRLQSENIRLNETIGELAGTIDKLEDTEQALDVITQTQGQSVAAFAQQVKEHEDILNQMRKHLKANKVQNLLQVIIRADQDNNMQIDEDEIVNLLSKIKKINGVDVREDRFRAAVKASGGSLSSVMDIIRNLLSDEISEANEIFIIKNELE
jgi:cell division protein FtsI/penicillin-binding protein 2